MREFLAVLAIATFAVSARAAEPDWAAARTIEVKLSSFAFSPERIEMRSGEAIRLHLINSSSGGHNFDAAQFFKAAQLAAADRGRIKGGKIEVKAGSPADIRLVAPPPGSYKLRCSHLLHSSFGMTGEIVVR